MNRKIISTLIGLAALGFATQSQADTVGWTNWTSATLSSGDGTAGSTYGAAAGTMTFGSNNITVNYTGELNNATEIGGAGTNYFAPTSTYTSATVSNAPPGGNMVAVSGGTSFTDTVTFSSPVEDFLMAFVSLGNPSTAVTYQFNTELPISVLSTGPNLYYGEAAPLTIGHNIAGDDTVTGQESDGVIQFSGYFSSISWTIPGNGEYYDAWTFGAIAQAPAGAQPGPLPSGVPLPSSAWAILAMLGCVTVAWSKKRLGAIGRLV